MAPQFPWTAHSKVLDRLAAVSCFGGENWIRKLLPRTHKYFPAHQLPENWISSITVTAVAGAAAAEEPWSACLLPFLFPCLWLMDNHNACGFFFVFFFFLSWCLLWVTSTKQHDRWADDTACLPAWVAVVPRSKIGCFKHAAVVGRNFVGLLISP